VNSPEQSEGERVIEMQLLVNNIQSAVIANNNFVIDTDIIKKYNKIYNVYIKQISGQLP